MVMLRLGRREAYGEDDGLRDQDGVRVMGSRKHNEVSTARTLRPMSVAMTRKARPCLAVTGAWDTARPPYAARSHGNAACPLYAIPEPGDVRSLSYRPHAEPWQGSTSAICYA